LKPVWVESAQPKQALCRDGSQEQMSQNSPYLSQKGPKNERDRGSDWRHPPERVPTPLKGSNPMSRRTAQWFAIASLVLASFTTACTRSDATGPSADQTAPSFEGQGANN